MPRRGCGSTRDRLAAEEGGQITDAAARARLRGRVRESDSAPARRRRSAQKRVCSTAGVIQVCSLDCVGRRRSLVEFAARYSPSDDYVIPPLVKDVTPPKTPSNPRFWAGRSFFYVLRGLQTRFLAD